MRVEAHEDLTEPITTQLKRSKMDSEMLSVESTFIADLYLRRSPSGNAWPICSSQYYINSKCEAMTMTDSIDEIARSWLSSVIETPASGLAAIQLTNFSRSPKAQSGVSDRIKAERTVFPGK